MNIKSVKNKKIKKWKVGEMRRRKTKGGYGFHCSCGGYTTTRKGDELKVQKGVNGFIYHGRCSKCNSWVVLEYM